MGCHALLQGIFLTQGSNPCLLSPALAGGFFTTSATWEVSYICIFIFKFHQIVQLKCVPFKKIMGQQGEGNGTPLQYSFRENPRDGGALVGCRLWGRTELDMTEVT